MSAVSSQMHVLQSLRSRPSRSSAVTIGQRYVLDWPPPVLQIRGLDALGRMVCDWSVAVLEEVIADPQRHYLVRRHALNQLHALIQEGIRRGYSDLTWVECDRLRSKAIAVLAQSPDEDGSCENKAVEELSLHLHQAITDGVFATLPDF